MLVADTWANTDDPQTNEYGDDVKIAIETLHERMDTIVVLDPLQVALYSENVTLSACLIWIM